MLNENELIFRYSSDVLEERK